MGLLDLSLRHKLPLWGGLLILVTAVSVTGSNLWQTRENIQKSMLARSEILGRSLVRTLYSAISQDDVWRAYEIISFPMRAEERRPSFQLENFILLDDKNQVFISTATKRFPLQAKLVDLGPAFAQLEPRLAVNPGHTVTVESEQLLLAIPLVMDGVTLGTLILVHPADYYRASYDRIFMRTAWTTLFVLLLLLPVNWYWGRRMASPLTMLAGYMGALGRSLPPALPERIYQHGDELGRLFRVYDQMRQELTEKKSIERQMMKTDRMASLGRLTASIAHEINNPLGGLLTVVDTLKRHASPDPVVERVLPLLERGLTQIKEIVGALLVEAKARGRALNGQDIEDVHTLLAQEAKKRGVEWVWENSVGGDLSLPATLVRQVLINLVLNAVQAAAPGGRVSVRAEVAEGHLVLEVKNNGREISPELMEHLFEPFTGENAEGQGLGLWITHQIVEQLQGNIIVNSEVGETRFCVTLPLGEEKWPPPLCLIEDDETMGGALAMRFELEGFQCDWFKTGKAAAEALAKVRYDAVVSDILLPDITGEALYTQLCEQGDRLPPFIFMTGHGSVDQAVRLLKLGAVDYLLKPFEPDLLLGMLRELVSGRGDGEAPDSDQLGISPAMRALDEMLLRLAQSSASVLIVGESGVGKECVASKLHRLQNPGRPFVAANCGAFTEGLLEAELFGHEKGAFTGAVKAKKGVFEQAGGGTLFLDEIGDMPLAVQVKVLRAIQERQIVRVGSETPINVDFRLIAATHHDLKARVEQGAFREDLYYRINVIQLRVPPLRERREDILWLAARFLTQACRADGGRRKLLSPAAERRLLDFAWPGNVRELKHLLERACVLSDSPVLTPELLFGKETADIDAMPAITLVDHMLVHERDYILRALDARGWQIQETASLLGISRKNLWEKMKKHAISAANVAVEEGRDSD